MDRITLRSGCWLGRRDSNPRMTESKSVALPLGYTPMYWDKKRQVDGKSKPADVIDDGVGYRIRTDDLQCHKLAL